MTILDCPTFSFPFKYFFILSDKYSSEHYSLMISISYLERLFKSKYNPPLSPIIIE
jgi:hypothetical protein